MSARISPGGALLRASRVFALPPSLPTPMSSLFGSDTATLPHPIQQSITTPYAALQKGDWGFKRPLPLKTTTKTSTPFLRINAIDTSDQITDYTSSADHALTLRKFQELDMPFTIPMGKTDVKSTKATGTLRTPVVGYMSDNRRSIFDEEVDKIAGIEDKFGSEDKRWKFEGPWLAALNEGDFQDYVRRNVKGRKREFRDFLRKSLADRLSSEERRSAQIAKDYGKDVVPKVYKSSDVTEEQLNVYIKALRNDRKSLHPLIRGFLDLPPAPTRKADKRDGFSAEFSFLADEIRDDEDSGFQESDSPYADSGPPKTHPSAGLSYLRTSSFTPNHSVHGPREYKPPVESRIVVPKGVSGKNAQPLIGVGGIVCDIPTGSNAGAWNTRNNNHRQGASITGLLSIDPEKAGGAKAFVQPVHATMDPNGHVIMKVDAADTIALAVKQGRLSQLKQKRDESFSQIVSRSIDLENRPRSASSATGYGLGGSGGSGGSSSSTRFRPNFRSVAPATPVESDEASRQELDSIMKFDR